VTLNTSTYGWIGILAVLIYLSILMALGFVEPNYSHLQHFPSELGGTNASNASVMNTNFHVVGIMVIVFSYGLHKGLPTGKTGFWGPLMLAILGTSMFLSGFFQCAEGCLPTTFASKMHGIVGMPGLLASPLAPFLIYRRLKTAEQGWPIFYTKISLLAFAIQVLGILLLGPMMESGMPGLAIRILLVFQLAWPFTLAYGLTRNYHLR